MTVINPAQIAEPVSLRQLAAAFGLLLLLFLLTAFATGAGVVDDTYIFLRYVRNIWAGHGPVFNVGDPVEGYTSPLWLAVLTFLWQLPVPAPHSAVGASAVAAFVAVLLVAWRSGSGHRIGALIGAAFLASNPAFVYWGWSGMDTALFTLLFVGTILSFEAQLGRQGSMLIPGIWFALSAIARLEALWFAPFFAALIFRTYRDPRRSLTALVEIWVPAMLVIGAHLIWRHGYYGVWLPNTYYAKVGIPLASKLFKGLVYLYRAMLACAPLILVLVISVRVVGRPRRVPLAVPAAAIVWWLAYVVAVGGDHFALQRFVVPAIALCAVVGARLAGAAVESAQTRPAWIAAGAVLLINVFPLASPEMPVARVEVTAAQEWDRMGRWCADTLPPGSIAMLMVGAIPYYCQRETIDIVGLTDAHIAREGKILADGAAGHQKFDTDYVLARAPRFIFFPTLAQRPLFAIVESRWRLPRRTWTPFMTLVTDKRTLNAYDYRAQRLEDGVWIEYLERRHPDPAR